MLKIRQTHNYICVEGEIDGKVTCRDWYCKDAESAKALAAKLRKAAKTEVGLAALVAIIEGN